MSATINISRYLALSMVGVMAAGFVVILLYKLLADEKPKPMMLEKYRAVVWISGAGVFAFLLGLVLVLIPEPGYQSYGISLVASGFLTLAGAAFFNAAVAKSGRKAWPVVPAHCTDQQLQKRKTWSEGGALDCWWWHVTCEIDYEGKHYAISPKVHWSDWGQGDAPFWSEEKAQEFISRRISPKGECKVRVNPTNPFEAELL
jgi:hypothetical protein